MKIPKKISPDHIKDSIVGIRYTTKTPFEVAIGLFYKSLDNTFFYTNRPVGNKQPIAYQQIPLFYNEKIKIEIQPNSIVFSCLNEYISWGKFKPEIENVLLQLEKVNIIETYTRIGIRYINEYPNLDFKDCIKFSFTLGIPELNSDVYSFRSEFNVNDLMIILNLNNKVPVLSANPASNQMAITPSSYIDIDIIKDNINETEIKNLISYIEDLHIKEKEIFFNLLTEKYLETLNPTY